MRDRNLDELTSRESNEALKGAHIGTEENGTDAECEYRRCR